jgi:antirestriction protein ArdC
VPFKGINVVMLWSAAVTTGYAFPLWLTFRQAIELGRHIRKARPANGGLRRPHPAYRNRRHGAATEREIPFMKGCTMFNAEQCDGLPNPSRLIR